MSRRYADPSAHDVEAARELVSVLHDTHEVQGDRLDRLERILRVSDAGRDPNRIPGLLATVEQAWRLAPDQRLGQFLLNLDVNFSLEDGELHERLLAYVSDAAVAKS